MTMDVSFKYADHENRHTQSHSVNATITVGDLKKLALENAPDDYKALRGPSDIRLVSMGRNLAPNETKLKEFKLPTLDTPTPIHVMFSREGVEYTYGKPACNKRCSIL